MQRARPVNLFASQLSHTIKTAEKNIQRSPLQRLFSLNDETKKFRQTLARLTQASKQLQANIAELETPTHVYQGKTGVEAEMRAIDERIDKLELQLRMITKLIKSESQRLLAECDKTVIDWQIERERRHSDPAALPMPADGERKVFSQAELSYYHTELQKLRKNILLLSQRYLQDYATALIAIRKARSRKEDLKMEEMTYAKAHDSHVTKSIFQLVLQAYRLFEQAKNNLGNVMHKQRAQKTPAKKLHTLKQSLEDADEGFRKIMRDIWYESGVNQSKATHAPQINAFAAQQLIPGSANGKVTEDAIDQAVMSPQILPDIRQFPIMEEHEPYLELPPKLKKTTNHSNVSFTHQLNRGLSFNELTALDNRPASEVPILLKKLVDKLKRNMQPLDTASSFILMNIENACVALQQEALKVERQRKLRFDHSLLSNRNKLAAALGKESAVYENAIIGFAEEIKAISLQNQAFAERMLDIKKITVVSVLKKSREFTQCEAQIKDGIIREKQKLICGRFCIFGSKSTKLAYARLVELHRRKKILAGNNREGIKLQLLQFIECQKESETIPHVPTLNRSDESDYIRAAAVMKESLKGQCHQVSASYMQQAVQVYQLLMDFDQHYASPSAKELLATGLKPIERTLNRFFHLENNIRRMSFQYCLKAEKAEPVIDANPRRRARVG